MCILHMLIHVCLSSCLLLHACVTLYVGLLHAIPFSTSVYKVLLYVVAVSMGGKVVRPLASVDRNKQH